MSEDKKVQLPLGIKEILELLPHRYPFIMLDRILEFEPDKSITALKNVTIGEPFFQGHFPGEPVMPGVLILEGMAQAGAVLAYLSTEDIAGKLVYFAGMDKVRFRRVVRPGDQLIYTVELTRKKGKIIKVQCQAHVDGVLVTEAEQMASFS